MNLIGRFFLLLVRALFRALFQRSQVSDPLAPIHQYYRVWPHDMDINIHLTAARYFSFGDLCRTQWIIDTGMGPAYLKAGYRIVLNAQEMTYIREFRPFSRVKVQAQLVCWDEKYGYFEQRYYHGDQLYSVGHARVAVLQKGKVKSLDAVFQEQGMALTSPPETEAVTDWKATLAAKRSRFS
ncbi:thioesterase family protein [Saccharospirillum mangrovi]|nr:thioesterase family protein [Saccharospirillum mangrovi]